MADPTKHTTQGGAEPAPTGGLDLDLTPRSPTIDLPEAERVLRLLAEPLRATGVAGRSERPTAAGALVETATTGGSGKVFVKRFPPRTAPPATIAPIHRFAAHLRSRGVPVPPFLPFADGASEEPRPGEATLLVLDGCLHEVAAEARGEDRYERTPSWTPPETTAEGVEIGRAAASIALAAADFREPAAPVGPFRSGFELLAGPPLDRAEGWLAERPGVRRYLADTGRPLVADLQAQYDDFAGRLQALWPRLGSSWVHGDLHVSNLFWSGSAVTAVIDLGIAGRAFPLYDLAVAIERNALLWPEILHGDDDAFRMDLVEAILRGYHELRPLSPAERAALPALLPVVQSESALHWIEYQFGIGDDRAAADWSYEHFFLAHAGWFRTPGGRRFEALLDERVRALPDPPPSS